MYLIKLYLIISEKADQIDITFEFLKRDSYFDNTCKINTHEQRKLNTINLIVTNGNRGTHVFSMSKLQK